MHVIAPYPVAPMANIPHPLAAPMANVPLPAAAPQACVPSPTLAPHETLELHETLAYKSNGLIRLKRIFPFIADPELKRIYAEAIRSTEQDIREILGLLHTYAVPEL